MVPDVEELIRCDGVLGEKRQGGFPIERGSASDKRTQIISTWEVVVAQLAERSLPTPEVHGSNPVIGKILNKTFVYSQL